MVSVLSSQDQLCATVKAKQVKGNESQPSMVESLLVDTRLSAHKIFHVFTSSFPLKYVDRSSKSDSNSSVTTRRIVVPLCDHSQSELKVPQDKKAIETPKVPNSSFNPAVFRRLTLVPIKRVLGVPVANEIGELMAQPQRVNSN
jgi:hypothetical protein